MISLLSPGTFVIYYSNISRYRENLEEIFPLNWFFFYDSIKFFLPLFSLFLIKNQWWNFLKILFGYDIRACMKRRHTGKGLTLLWQQLESTKEIFRVNTLDVHSRYRPQMFFQYFSWFFIISCASTPYASMSLEYQVEFYLLFVFAPDIYLKASSHYHSHSSMNLILYSFEEEEKRRTWHTFYRHLAHLLCVTREKIVLTLTLELCDINLMRRDREKSCKWLLS